MPLPIDASIPQLVEGLRARRSLVVVAEPGAGKTTRVPPAVLSAERLLSREHPNVVMLQPRRVAARAAAERIADERGWALGREVGYHIRFDRRVSRDTRLRIMTEGILTRQLLDDPFLEGVGAVVLDEFHERSIHTDLAIALLRDVRQSVRPDLVLIVMSATLDAEPVATFLGGCPVVRVEGRTFAVEVTHDPRHGVQLSEQVVEQVERIVDRNEPGDVLVFLPGAAEIRRAMRQLEPLAQREDLLVLPLHGSLPSSEQTRALKPAARRKIICATNIAETSLTIDGVRFVIDSGLARVAGYDPRRGLDRLEMERISKASATQRAGRAGRTAAGRCVRLWSVKEFHESPAFELPEIRRVDLCGTVLALHAWGHSDPRSFPWYEPPDDATIQSAEKLLHRLGALDSARAGRITELGRTMLSIPAHPRVARLLVAGAKVGLLHDAAAIAAIVTEKDFVSDDRPAARGSSDVLARTSWLDEPAARTVAKLRDELIRLGRRLPAAQPSPANRDEALLKLILLAYPDRVARRRGESGGATMVGGGGVRLSKHSVVHDWEFFVAADARHDERNPAREAIVRLASGVRPEWLEELFPQAVRRERAARFDAASQRVVGTGRLMYEDLVLREERDASVEPQLAADVLADAVRPRAREVFEQNEAAAALLARVRFMRRHMPEHRWPEFDDQDLAQVLTEACAGKRSVEELRRADLAGLLRSRLPYPLDRLLEEHAPCEVRVPSGRAIRIEYPSGEGAPVLSVRLQELFGLSDTPRLAAGRVPLVLHLLGPNYRPVQITDDLRSFWTSTYFQVRKDLRVRYPKHSWPENPLIATPEAKGFRRKN